MNANTAANLAHTIYAIARSPAVSEYMIGITARPNLNRRREYSAKHGYQHLVVLADNLQRDEASRIEECLQGYIHDVKNLSVFKKYEKSRRMGRYHQNLGQALTGFSVYMAWRE
jgi:hypothetical protein